MTCFGTHHAALANIAFGDEQGAGTDLHSQRVSPCLPALPVFQPLGRQVLHELGLGLLGPPPFVLTFRLFDADHYARSVCSTVERLACRCWGFPAFDTAACWLVPTHSVVPFWTAASYASCEQAWMGTEFWSLCNVKSFFISAGPPGPPPSKLDDLAFACFRSGPQC